MATKKTRPFDFSKLKKLSSKFVNINQALLEQYPQLAEPQQLGEGLLKSLAADLSLPLNLKYVGMEEGEYGRWIHSLSSPCVAVLLQAEPQEGKIILELDYSLSRMLVDRLLGGEGMPPQDRLPLSPMEEGVLEFLICKSLNHLQDSPGIRGPTKFKIIKIVQEAKMIAEATGPAELGCIFKFYLRLGKEGGYLNIYFPHPLVEGVFLREDVLAGVVAPADEALLEKRLWRASHIKTSLWSEIGRVQLRAVEKDALEKGDVILFDETLAAMSSHGLAGKAVLRVGENPHEGLLTEVIDTEGKLVLKILDYYGGE